MFSRMIQLKPLLLIYFLHFLMLIPTSQFLVLFSENNIFLGNIALTSLTFTIFQSNQMLLTKFSHSLLPQMYQASFLIAL